MTATRLVVDEGISANPFATTSFTQTYLPAVQSSTSNATSTYLRTKSAKDLFYYPFRVASEIDRLLFRTLPHYILSATGLETWAQTANENMNDLIQAGGEAGGRVVVEGAGNVAAAGQLAGQTTMGGFREALSEALRLSNVRSYWGMLNYITSRWAFTCFSMALVLNRVSIYGSSRQRVFLTWDKRLVLRILPIFLLVWQITSILQALQCQNSPDFSVFRHGKPDSLIALDWASEGGFLHWLSSTTLHLSSDADSCAAVGMSRPSPGVRAPSGSFSLLWPTYLRICLSQFVETISCTLQQQPVVTEVGMSVFEHSLAFAEAETMLSHILGIGLFSSSKPTNSSEIQNSTFIPTSATAAAISEATTTLIGPQFLDRLNVPSEVLLMALLSCCNSLTANLIAVFNKQRQLRLLNTGLWGFCFMASFVWGFFNHSPFVKTINTDNAEDVRFVSGLLHFPTVCIVGFVPHLIILVGIGMCIGIYLLALILTAMSLETNPGIPKPSGLRDRFSIAHENLQASIQVRGIDIKWHEDFYTTLLRVGFVALNAASEAVFLNEGRSVEVRQFTWLEEEKLDEVEASQSGKLASAFGSPFQISEEYGLPSRPGAEGARWESGYGRERKLGTEKESSTEGRTSIVHPHPRPGGVGALQRTTRFYLLLVFLRGIFFLITGWLGYGYGLLLDRMGVTVRPRWLRRLVGKSLRRAALEQERSKRETKKLDSLDFWLLSEEGELITPRSDEMDIEPEMRRRLMLEHTGGDIEGILDKKLYGWWKMGGWWGTEDGSGEYRPPHEGDYEDNTSVVSMSTSASTTDEERDWESESDGRRTPTQRNLFPSAHPSAFSSRESTPGSMQDTTLDTATLARLLNPPDRASRDEARILASHLATSSGVSYPQPRIMTRSRYRQDLETERSRVLLSGRRPKHTLSNAQAPTTTDHEPRPLTSVEEAEILESLILARRKARTSTFHHTQSVPEDSSSSSDHGPMCVVCQSCPRTIIAWPCRCLCVCEDCRVSLALNNFGNCVTCRRQVSGFVRLWVP